MSLHILGLGSIGLINAHLLLTKLALQISYFPRPTSPTTYKIHHNGQSHNISNLINDGNGSTVIERLLVTTKAHHTREAITPYINRISKDTLLIFLQNGMGVLDSIQDILPSKRMVLGITTHGAYRNGRDNVHWVHAGETLFAGVRDTTISAEEKIILECMGKIVSYEVLEDRLYRKLAGNACINPVTAVYDCRNGVVDEKESEAHSLSLRLIKEVKEVYSKVRPQMDVSRLEDEVMQLARDNRDNISSMLADVRSGRDTEIEFINGNIVKMGRDVGVNVPENENIIKRIKGLRLR
jgi:2-dehydropantoate 2-reductase